MKSIQFVENYIIFGEYETYFEEIDSEDLNIGDIIASEGSKNFPPTFYEVCNIDEQGWYASGGQDMYFSEVPRVLRIKTRKHTEN